MGKLADHQPHFCRFLRWSRTIKNHRDVSRPGSNVPRRYFSKTHSFCPDYKPLPLRWPFLSVLFLYVCALVALLEYAFHTLPVVNDRISGFRPQTVGGSQSTPTTTLPTAALRNAKWKRKPSTLPHPVRATPTPETASSPSALTHPTPPGDNILTAAVATSTIDAPPTRTEELTLSSSVESYIRPTSFPAWTYHRPNHTSWEFLDHTASASVLIANRPEPWQYARLGPDSVLAHYVLAFEWTHGPDNFLATPVPPGTDVSDRCVKHNVMGWVTHDPDDCPVLIPLDVWENPRFSGAFGPIRGGDAFFDADCRRSDSQQVALLDPYWDQPDCWADEAAKLTILHFPSTVGSSESITKMTKVVTGASGELVTFVERLTLGSDIATIKLNPSQVITTTRQRADTNPIPGIIATLTDSLGRATATVTSFPFGFSQHAIPIALRDSAGRPTATTWEYESLGTRLTTLTDEHGMPTATVTGYFRERPTNGEFPFVPDPYHPSGGHVLFFGPLSRTDYLVGSFIPVLVGTILAILVKAIQANIQSLLPFHALTRPGGAAGSDSVYLTPGGLRGPLKSWRLLFRFQEPLAMLSDITVFLSALIVALSSEAVGVTLVGDCSPRDYKGCFLTLSVVWAPARAAEAALICVAVLVTAMGYFLCRWRTGIAASPWSILSLASLLPLKGEQVSIRSRSLSLAKGTRSPVTDSHEVSRLRFALGRRSKLNDEGNGNYGIMAWSDCTDTRQPAAISSDEWPSTLKRFDKQLLPRRSFVSKRITILVFIGLVCGFSTIIIIYETTRTSDSFEKFMNGQNFGNSFLFTSLGVVLSFFWDGFYSWTTMMEPYRRLAACPQPAERSILIPQASTAFTGLWQAIQLLDFFGAAVAFASILSKFVPILLANIPFRLTLTWTTHHVCTWLSVAILTTMILVLISSFFVKWPCLMPEPNTIAGCMYYVSDSEMLRDLEDMSMMNQKERGKWLRKENRRYYLLATVDKFGESRTKIDYYADKQEIYSTER